MSLVERLRAALAAEPPHTELLLPGDSWGGVPVAETEPVPAAVLFPIVERPEPGLILTVRTETVRRHAGQIAFPGGRIDPEDEGPVAAALREAWEEIALPPAEVRIIGLADRYRTVTGYEVIPVLGLVPSDLPLVPQPEEVAAIFEAPLRHLLDPDHQIVRSALWQGRERRYYEIEWEGRRIWGATAAMIVNLTRRLAASK
jgi:8-oxo-dGTP pyrophosphatase MutT (NUDIX family)